MKRYIPELSSAAERAEEAAIRSLADRYTDAVNQRDWDTVADTWAEDGVWELGAPVSRREKGRAAIMEEVQRAVGAMAFFLQMPHAFTLLSLEGDRAQARVTLHEIAKIKPENLDLMNGATGMSIHAVYTDDLRRDADGHWRFVQRRYDVKLYSPEGPTGDIIAP